MLRHRSPIKEIVRERNEGMASANVTDLSHTDIPATLLLRNRSYRGSVIRQILFVINGRTSARRSAHTARRVTAQSVAHLTYASRSC